MVVSKKSKSKDEPKIGPEDAEFKRYTGHEELKVTPSTEPKEKKSKVVDLQAATIAEQAETIEALRNIIDELVETIEAQAKKIAELTLRAR